MVTTTVQEINFGANFKQLCLERAVARTHNNRLKEINKRRTLRGKQTIVVLNPFFLLL